MLFFCLFVLLFLLHLLLPLLLLPVSSFFLLLHLFFSLIFFFSSSLFSFFFFLPSSFSFFSFFLFHFLSLFLFFFFFFFCSFFLFPSSSPSQVGPSCRLCWRRNLHFCKSYRILSLQRALLQRTLGGAGGRLVKSMDFGKKKSKKVEISVDLRPILGKEAYNKLDPISR